MGKSIGSFVTKHWQWMLASACTAIAALVVWSFTAGVFITETRMDIASIREDMGEMKQLLTGHIQESKPQPRQAVAMDQK